MNAILIIESELQIIDRQTSPKKTLAVSRRLTFPDPPDPASLIPRARRRQHPPAAQEDPEHEEGQDQGLQQEDDDEADGVFDGLVDGGAELLDLLAELPPFLLGGAVGRSERAEGLRNLLDALLAGRDDVDLAKARGALEGLAACSIPEIATRAQAVLKLASTRASAS